jgi:DNA-binding NarL/FixJ family response regulator
MNDPIRVLLAEDNADLSEILQALLAEQPDMRCMASVGSLPELRERADAAGHCVVVLDIELRGESSLRQLRSLRESMPEASFVIFSGHNHPELTRAAMAGGAARYVVKSEGPEALLSAIREASPTTRPPH